MLRRFCVTLVATVCMSSAAATCQQMAAPDATPAVVQPGAPGQANKILTPSTTGLHLMPPNIADTRFMQGMIMHHGQAVEMTELVKTHTQDPEVLEIGRRIGVSQTSEMAFMKVWLTDRGFPLEEPGAMGDMKGMDMGGMDMKDMKGMDMGDMDMPPMPGMLTRKQMEALRNATGPQFNHLFLTGMIQHHGGALTMVKDLFNQPAAVQDPTLFDFASDVDNTQTAEIDMMYRAIKHEEKK